MADLEKNKGVVGLGWSGRKERIFFLFNDALNTFYLRLYVIGHMVKDHSDSEKGNTCRHMGYYFQLAARDLL